MPGHWEGDLIVGSNNSYIATLVERYTRYAMLMKVPSKDTETVINTAIQKRASDILIDPRSGTPALSIVSLSGWAILLIVASYLGSLLMAGAYLAIGACMSALTKNQVIAFVVSVVVCLMLVLSGFPVVLDFVSAWAPAVLVEAISSFSFLTHFNAIGRGVIDLRDIVYFVSLIALFLFANVILIELKKAD